MKNDAAKTLTGVLRISLGWIFFWAFIDKVFGLGFATAAERAWLNGASPTAGFLGNATKGPFAELFGAMAGQVWVDWLFMLGLLGIGLALILGIGLRIAAVSGATMMLLMYLAVIPPANNPIVDDHIIYALVVGLFPLLDAGQYLGLGKWWSKQKIVKQYPILK